MTKILVGDVCRKQGRLTETDKWRKAKGYPELKLDLCDKHLVEVSRRYPEITPEYVQFVFSMTRMPITLVMAEEYLRR